jgi:ABC-type antimicrobial peptide transport system permease subunit
VPALRPADLVIEAGDYVAVTGPSGSGKSTLLHLLGLRDSPTEGSYLLDGLDTSALNDRDRSALRGSRIGFVFQAFHLAGLFLILALVSLLIGAVGIANTTLVAVLERTEEIGLRRAVGARPRHIAAQFLAESTALGTLGGLAGTCIGVGVVVIFAAVKDWTAVLNPAYTLPAPLIGSVVGLLAGVYPALRAARTSPLAALRHA